MFDCIALYRTSVAMYIVQLLKLYFVQVTISDILLYILYCTVFLCIVFLMLQPCVVHGNIRTQNHEVVLHFTIACCNIGVYTGVYCYIVVLVHGYIRAQNQGCSVTPVSCCSTSSLAQLDPQFITLEDWTTIPTNSPRYPQILELLHSVDSTQMP